MRGHRCTTVCMLFKTLFTADLAVYNLKIYNKACVYSLVNKITLNSVLESCFFKNEFIVNMLIHIAKISIVVTIYQNTTKTRQNLCSVKGGI